ncbi:MAG: ester cyclase [Woeseiaceae bacterium]|nr:ester cyclase [Woeseiaceae bacterium]
MSDIAQSKQFFERFRAALYDCDRVGLPDAFDALVHPDCDIVLPQPMGPVTGPDALFESAYAPLLDSIPDLERRDTIMVGGEQDGEHWIGCGGHYQGVFDHPWLDIPATRHLVHIRYIEFFRIDDDKIVSMRLLWDIPSVMMQADAWPMAPSLGREILVPGPADNKGIVRCASEPEHSAASMQLVNDMVEGLGRFAEGGAEAMQLDRFWHPKMTWYGPAGIGSNRRLSGFRNWHQIPFLKSLPDRVADKDGEGRDCYFADGDYVAFCGWPAMRATVTGDGWMGIAPSNREIHFASLDLWRCENGVIRENWVMIDILDVWRQLGVDVMERMRETTFARQPIDFKV